MEGERFWPLNIRRRIGMETQFRRRRVVVLISLMYPRDYPTIILFVRSLGPERKPKAETGASAKIEHGEASGAVSRSAGRPGRRRL